MASTKIHKARFYILKIKSLTDIRCLYYYFSSRESAKYALNKAIASTERKWYKIVSGAYLSKYQPNFYKALRVYPVKYKYPPHLTTKQQRKTHRTVMRRRLRRLGLHVVGKKEGKIVEEIGRTKWIKNKQKVAKSPGSVARVIQVDSKGLNKYFVVRGIVKSKRSGDLCRASCYLFDTYKGTITKKEIRIKNTDVITPYLTTELKKVWENKGYKLKKKWIRRLTIKSLKPIKQG